MTTSESMPATRVGVISDTHGLLRTEALQALAGCDLIVHAGDIGEPSILERLRQIAPVVAIRGNVDRAEWTRDLPVTEFVEVGSAALYLIHDLQELDLEPAAAGIGAVIYGHSHRPRIEWRNGTLYLNPGSAGPRRFQLPITLAIVNVIGNRLEPVIVDLEKTART